jgi:N12 class adenine-specific DNA methylase
MGKTQKLLSLCLILVLAGIVFAQEVKIISHVPNVARIARNWNALNPLTQEWNEATAKTDLLLHARFNSRVVDVNEERAQRIDDDRRRACVRYYKQAKEALLKQVEALNELIDEEDY